MEHQTLIDANEASRLCRLSKATIYKLVQQGRVRGFRVLNRTLRFDPDDITALVRQLPIVNDTHRSVEKCWRWISRQS